MTRALHARKRHMDIGIRMSFPLVNLLVMLQSSTHFTLNKVYLLLNLSLAEVTPIFHFDSTNIVVSGEPSIHSFVQGNLKLASLKYQTRQLTIVFLENHGLRFGNH